MICSCIKRKRKKKNENTITHSLLGMGLDRFYSLSTPNDFSRQGWGGGGGGPGQFRCQWVKEFNQLKFTLNSNVFLLCVRGRKDHHTYACIADYW